MEHAWIDPTGQPLSVTHFPTALLYGYSVYTTLRLPLEDRWLQAHWRRLRHDAAALGLSCPWDDATLASWVAQPQGEVLRITLLPQTPNFHALVAGEAIPTTGLLSWRQAPAAATRPLRVRTAFYENPLAGIKHGGMTAALALKRHARQQGDDDVLWFNRRHEITEATTANVFAWREGVLYTPPVPDCLPGITRQRLLEGLPPQGIPVVEGEIPLEALSDVEGLFLTNAVTGVQAVEAIDNQTLPWTAEAQRVYHAAQGLLKSP